jgi:hypothetical protein
MTGKLDDEAGAAQALRYETARAGDYSRPTALPARPLFPEQKSNRA